jgi:hypothetical protein
VDFLKNHLALILHNAIGQLIAFVILAAITSGTLLTIIKLFRVSAFSIVTIKVPLWSVVLIIVICILLFARNWIRKRIKIRSANYGYGSAQPDVTDRVRAHVHGGVLDVLATTDELRDGNDPFHGVTKALTINYTLNGRDRTIQVIEGSRLILP